MGLFQYLKNRRAEKQQVKGAAIQQEKPSVGITFSGGGARGFGHIGAIKAFAEEGLDFAYVTGTSAGAIIGALYAAGITWEQMQEFAKTLDEKEIRNSKIPWSASRSSNIEVIVRKFLGDLVFSELKKPFACVATDIKSGQEVVLSSGSVPRAVSASCAVPGLFTPVIWQDYVLQDGGLVNPIPSDVARQMGADKVVAVDINSTRGYGTDSTKTIDILLASLRISMKVAAEKGIHFSDVIIRPDLKKYKSTKLESVEEMVEEGYRATIEAMPKIKHLFET